MRLRVIVSHVLCGAVVAGHSHTFCLRAVWILVKCDREEIVIAIGGLDGSVAANVPKPSNRFARSRCDSNKIGDGSKISARRTNKCRYWISFLKLSYFELLRLPIHVSCVRVWVWVCDIEAWARQRCIRYVCSTYDISIFTVSLLASDDEVFWLMHDECTWNRCAIASECWLVELSALRWHHGIVDYCTASDRNGW